MRDQEEDRTIKDVLSILEFLQWGANLLALFSVSLGLYFWLSYNPQVLYGRTLAKDELLRMSVREYIGLMQETSVMGIPETVEGWPRKKDISYLFILTERSHYAGSTISLSKDEFPRSGFESTVGITAVHLLKAIKEGSLHPYMGHQYPPDKDEIIAWARAEMKEMREAGE